jgi:hypothetical protein
VDQPNLRRAAQTRGHLVSPSCWPGRRVALSGRHRASAGNLRDVQPPPECGRSDSRPADIIDNALRPDNTSGDIPGNPCHYDYPSPRACPGVNSGDNNNVARRSRCARSHAGGVRPERAHQGDDDARSGASDASANDGAHHQYTVNHNRHHDQSYRGVSDANHGAGRTGNEFGDDTADRSAATDHAADDVNEPTGPTADNSSPDHDPACSHHLECGRSSAERRPGHNLRASRRPRLHRVGPTGALHRDGRPGHLLLVATRRLTHRLALPPETDCFGRNGEFGETLGERVDPNAEAGRHAKVAVLQLERFGDIAVEIAGRC